MHMRPAIAKCFRRKSWPPFHSLNFISGGSGINKVSVLILAGKQQRTLLLKDGCRYGRR